MLNNRKSNIFEEVENLKNENGALKRAVESKSAAIGILRSELENCQRERDEFRMIAETHPVSQPSHSFKPSYHFPEKTHSAILSGSENTLAQLLSQSKEENKQIRQELTDLRCRLHDAQSDLKILRAENSRKTDSHQSRLSIATSSQLAQQERETHIQQMEQISSKCQAQEADLRCLLEEREELITERDEIRHKLHRLNHVLNVLLSQDYLKNNHPRHRTVNLDAIITENRYLQQRMKQLEEEKALAIANCSKYKSALENCRTNSSSLKLGTSDKLIMSPKQVSEILKQYQGEIGENAGKDLKLLCLALVDSLNQKSRAVKTQKAANKMLIERVADLERRLVYCDDRNSPCRNAKSETTLVSASLMENYNPSITVETKSIDVSQVLEEVEREHNLKLSSEANQAPRQPLQQSPKDTKFGESDCNREEKRLEIEDDSQAEENGSANGRDSNNSKVSEHLSNSDSEEIVPLEDLDSYILNLKHKRGKHKAQKDSSPLREPEVFQVEPEREASPNPPATPSGSSSNTSFEIDISDYDSNDDNLEATLNNWQSEFEKSSCSKILSKLSPKRVQAPGFLKDRRKRKEKQIELPEKLKEILK